MNPKQAEALKRIKEIDDLFIYPNDIAPVLESCPQTIRTMAHVNPVSLGFKVTVQGKIVKIPRLPFLRWLEVNIP